MPYVLLSLIWVSTLALFANVASGLHYWGADRFLTNHIAGALTATLFILLAHTMTMFYFIGSAKKIKEYTAEWEEGAREKIRQKTILTKKKLFPHMTLICLLVVAMFIVGGAHYFHLVQKSTHGYLVYAVLVYHTHVSTLETIHIFRNIALIDEVNRADHRS